MDWVQETVPDRRTSSSYTYV